MKHLRFSILLTAATAVVAFAASPAPIAAATDHPGGTPVGAVFVQTNDLAHNAVVAYDRAADGTLTKVGTYATGGAGAAEAGAVVDPLASQSSLTLDQRQGLLFVVNGGSNSITVFGMEGSRLVRR